jgi:nucleotide-binding universal stress UspA family protein
MQTTYTGIPTFHRILLATDFSAASQSAFETALAACKTFNADLCVLHVFEYAPVVPPKGPPVIESTYAEAERSLDELNKKASENGVTCDYVIAAGMAAPTILETIQEKNIDLVVLGTNASRGLERLIFGSTAESVLRKATCAVITVGPRVPSCAKPTKFEGPVVFATDFHATTVHAIRHAASICHVTGAQLHCVTVLPTTLEGNHRSRIVPDVMNLALHHVALETDSAIAPPTCTTIFGSEASSAVVNYARKINAAFIVLGVQPGSPIASHGPWNATYRLIVEACCPVLTVTNGAVKHAHEEIEAENHFDFENQTGNPRLHASWLRRRKLVA